MSRTASTYKKTIEREAIRGGSAVRTRSPSPSLRRSSRSPLRSSSRLTKSLANSSELREIENDYVRNLQQQIYFLELEANHLRDQNKKATQLHPQLVAETDRMRAKLKNLQLVCDELNLECSRKDASLDVIHHEKDRVLTKLEEEEIQRQREKGILTDELISLKRERDRLILENERRLSRIGSVETDKERLVLELNDAENKIETLQSQVYSKIDQNEALQMRLEEKKAHCLQAESHAREVEDKYFTQTAVLHENQLKDLKNEIRMLRAKLNEAEMQANDEYQLKLKMQDESSQLMKEKSLITQKADDLSKQLGRERELRESTDIRRSQGLVEISRLGDKEKELKLELRAANEDLRLEKARAEKYLVQLHKQEELASSLDVANASLTSKLAEFEGRTGHLEDTNVQLRRDKQLLVDHVAELQKQVSRKGDELSITRRQMKVLEKDLVAVETDKAMDDTMQSQKWQEFESLADSMKSLTRTMGRSTSPTRSPRSTRRIFN